MNKEQDWNGHERRRSVNYESPAMRVLHSWERRLLIVAFGGWAAVVAVYGQQAVNRIDVAVADAAAERKSQAEYKTIMERRVTVIESQQALLIRMMDQLEKREVEHEQRTSSAQRN